MKYAVEQWHDMLYRIYTKYPFLNYYSKIDGYFDEMKGNNNSFNPKTDIIGFYISNKDLPWVDDYCYNDYNIFMMPDYENGTSYVSTNYHVPNGKIYVYGGLIKFKTIKNDKNEIYDNGTNLLEVIKYKETDIENFIELYLNAIKMKKNLK